jgi:hypothetical protein
VSPCRSLTLERRPLPKIRLLLRVSRPRPHRLRLPRHLGAIVFLAHTPVSTPAVTFAPSRRCDCGGISTRRLLPSASTPVSSCVVPPLRLRVDVRQCVCECVGRHHCWAAGPLGLGFHVSLYIVVHLYAIQQFTILHSLAQMNPLCLYQCPPQGWMAGSMHVLGLGELLCLLPLLCCRCQFCVWLEG